MKLSNEAFPYPILTSGNEIDADYEDSAFQCTLSGFTQVEENNKKFIKVSCTFLCSEENIKKHIDNNKAKYSIHVKSKSTGFNNIFVKKDNVDHFLLPLNKLYKQIQITPLIIAVDEINKFTSDNFNDEYLIDNDKKIYSKFDINYGDILAFDETIYKYINHEPQSLTSLLSAKLDKNLPPFVYSINPNDDYKLVIYMGENIYSMFKDPDQKEFIITGIIKDCILIAINEFKENEEQTIEKKWAFLVIDKLNEMKINLDDLADINELNILAQKISSHYGIERIGKV